MQAPQHPNFNSIARPYRWLEYLTFGPYLERARFHFLPQLTQHRRALVLGDGDGRFTARLLAANPEITIDAIDSSSIMLQLLTERATRLGPRVRQRLRTIHTSALNFTPEAHPPGTWPYDLVVTHFFLDCFTEGQITTLLHRIRPNLSPEAIWLVSEFTIPPSGPMKPVAKLVIATLYRAFQVFTGLKTRTLPNYAACLRSSGLSLMQQESLLKELLITQLWQLDSSPPEPRAESERNSAPAPVT